MPEFAALAAQASHELDEGRITHPEIMRGAELSDDAPRDRRPLKAAGVPRGDFAR
jgi:hypothetical protein